MCSGSKAAIQTLTSGKLNPGINLIVSQPDWLARQGHKRRIQIEPLFGPMWPGRGHGTLDTLQNQLSGRAAAPRRQLVQSPVQVTRQVNTCTNGIRLHGEIVSLPT